MRLRVFDLATPWFWVVVFYQRGHGVVAHKYPGPRPGWTRGWLHVWEWESLPDTRGQEVSGDS